MLTILIIILVIIIALLVICKKLKLPQVGIPDTSETMSGGGNSGGEKDKPIEYEYQFVLSGKNSYGNMLRRLKKLDAKRVGTFLMSVTVYNNDTLPANEDDIPVYVRIRRETPSMSTFTVKTGSSKFPTEREIEVTPEQASVLEQMMLDMGNTIKYKVEKIRELWTLPSMPDVKEITFDTYPGLPQYMEVDAHSEKALYAAMNALELTIDDSIPDKNEAGVRIDGYKYFYGIPTTAEGRKLPPGANLTFAPAAKEQFDQYLDADQSNTFDALLEEQIKKADTLRV